MTIPNIRSDLYSCGMKLSIEFYSWVVSFRIIWVGFCTYDTLRIRFDVNSNFPFYYAAANK